MTRLEKWEEITGTLQGISESSRGIEVTIDETSIILEKKVEKDLQQAVGSEVSILRTDTDYFVRVGGDK